MERQRTLRWAPAFVALVALGRCGAPAIKASTRGGGADPSTSTSSSTGISSTTSSTSLPAVVPTTDLPPSTTSTTVPSPTTQAASSRWHFEGKHSGTEHYVLNRGRCAFLDHHLQETFTLADGRTWSFDARYCGTIDEHNVWSGVGSFSLATAPGSELAARLVRRAGAVRLVRLRPRPIGG